MTSSILGAISLLTVLAVVMEAQAEPLITAPPATLRAASGALQPAATPRSLALSHSLAWRAGPLSAPSWSQLATRHLELPVGLQAPGSYRAVALPLLVNPLHLAWETLSQEPSFRLQFTALDTPNSDLSPAQDDFVSLSTSGPGRQYAVPPLIRYAPDDGSTVSVSVAPGSGCTGACLKVAGTF